MAARQTGKIKPAVRTALMLIPIGMGLLLAVAAPGNQVRMATDGAHQSGMGWLIASILWTMRDAVKFILRFSLKTPLLALLLLAAPTLCAQMNAKHEKGATCPPIGAVWLGLYLILCAMIIPHMYSSGYAGSGRVVNMYHCYVLLAMPIALAMSLARMKEKKRDALASRRGRAFCYALAAAAFALCIAADSSAIIISLSATSLTARRRRILRSLSMNTRSARRQARRMTCFCPHGRCRP